LRSEEDTRIGWVEFDLESGLMMQVRGTSYRGYKETRTHVISKDMQRLV
jgi:hypothetical protein